MSDESVSKTCPQCGAAVPDDAPGGFCPKCLMVQAAASTGGEGVSAEAKSPPSLEAVRAAFPQLEILEVIGQGGMGAVFKARQPKLNRFVALKILPERLAADPAFAERFAREGQMLARLNHPNIVAVHDFGESGGFYYLLMEYVDGVNLRQALRAGGFSPQQALGIVPKICEALQYAHDEGVLHRDIKPENILLDTKSRVKIADFGIAKFARENAPGQRLTGPNAALGTPHYMAPEQIERPADVDHRADIYSLGVVFYELLTGELPLGRFAPPSEKAAVDARVDGVVLKALEKERERRQQSAAQVKTQVETIVSGSLGAVGPAARPRPSRLFRMVVALIGVPALLLVGLTGTYLLSRERGPFVTTSCLMILGAIVWYLILWAFGAMSREDEEFKEHEGGLSAPRSQQMAALIVVLSVLIPVGGLMVAVTHERNARRSHAIAQVQLAELNAVRARIRLLSQKAQQQLDAATDAATRKQITERLQMLQKQAESTRREINVLPNRMRTAQEAFSIIPICGSILLVMLGLGVFGTVMGWRHLSRLRAMPPPRPRIMAAMFAAVFWPLLVLDGLIVLLILAPVAAVPGSVQLFALLLGGELALAACLVADIWLTRRIWRWVATLPQKAVSPALLARPAPAANPWPRRLFWLIVALVGMPAVLAAGMIAVYFLSYAPPPPAVRPTHSRKTLDRDGIHLQEMPKGNGPKPDPSAPPAELKATAAPAEPSLRTLTLRLEKGGKLLVNGESYVGDGLEIVQQIRDDAKLQVVIEAGAGVSEEDVQRIKQLVEVARQQRDPRNRELWEQIAQRQDATLRKEALEKLQAMLGSEQNPDREQAMRTLQKVKDVPFDRAPLLPRVRQLIADRRQTAYTRAIAAVQLANLGGGKEDTPLIAALADDPEAFVRKGVAAALYGLDPQGQHPLIAPAIEKLLSDESADVEGVVHHTIKALWGMPVSPAAEVRLVELSKLPGPSSGIGYDAVYYALSTRPVISKPVAERLAELALGPDTQGHVGRAVWGLSHHPASEDARELVVGTLIRILDDTLDSSLRQDCVFGLGLQGGPTAVKKLEEISAQEENAALREQAKSALGRAQAKAPSS